MKLLYVIFLALSGVAAAVTMAPNIALLAAIYTFGLAAPLLILAPNTFMVLLCLGPLVFWPRRLILSAPISAALIAAYFYGPGVASERVAATLVAEQAAQDHQTAGTLKTAKNAGIEIDRPATFNPNLWQQPLDQDICSTFCRGLLHGGQVDWVRVTFFDKKGLRKTSTFVRGTSEGCADTQCIEFAQNTKAPADVTITLKETYEGPYDANRNPKGWAQSQGYRRLVVTAGETEVLRQTEVHLFVIKGPVGLRPAFHGLTSGGNEGGLHYPRSRDVRNRIDPVAVAKTLGLNLAARLPEAENRNPGARQKRQNPKPPTAAARAEISSLLDRSGDLPQPLQKKINAWLMELRNVPTATAEDVALFMRIAEDYRVKQAFALPQVFFRQPDVRKVSLPWLFDRLEQKDLPKTELLRQLSSDLRYLRPAASELEPFADRFVALVKAANYNTPLLASAGLFGFDPTPMLRAAYTPGDNDRFLVMSAVCRSDPKWFEALVPFVRGMVADEIAVRPGHRLDGVIEDGLKFLAFMGHKDEARAIIERSQWHNKDWLLTRGFVSPDARPLRLQTLC